MAINQNSTPTLRFKDQQGNDYPDWESEPLSKIGKILTGTTPSTANKSLWNGDLQFITPSDINDSEKYQRFTQRYIKQTKKTRVVPPNSIIYTCIASIGKICISVQPCTTNQQINALTPGESYDSDYVYYSLLKMTPRIRATQSTTTLPIINKSEFEKIEIIVPCKQEQQKIASFLSSVDAKLEQLGKKKVLLEQYKKGIMQKLFNQKIRFKDEQGNAYPNWEERRLGDVLDYKQPTEYLVENSVYDDGHKTPVLTAGKTFLLGYTNEKTGIFIDKLPTIIFDDFTTAFKYVDFPFKAKSSAMKILIPKSECVNMKFVYEAMKRVRFPLGEHKRYWISEYQREKISYPNKEEQQKIADFLSAIDQKINLTDTQIKQARKFKKGLLQQMFI